MKYYLAPGVTHHVVLNSTPVHILYTCGPTWHLVHVQHMVLPDNLAHEHHAVVPSTAARIPHVVLALTPGHVQNVVLFGS